MTKKSITKKYNINGPVNIIRLTNTKKIVYIFGDFHSNINDQYECTYDKNIENINIDQFFRKIFKKNPDRKFDFFYEGYINQEPVINQNQKDFFVNNSNYRTENYFSQILKLVFNNIDIVDNKIHTSKQFNNIRLHYFNFRIQIPHMMYLFNNINNFISLSTSTNYKNTHNSLLNYKEMLSEIKTYINSNNNSYIVKIKSKYTNNKIKEKILQIFDININQLLDKILNLLDKTINYIENTSELYNKFISLDEQYNLNKLIYINITLLNNYILHLLANITDIYLIRRLIDKDYINNCIIYTGSYHMVHITYLLLKYFNFEITHISYTDTTIDNNNIENTNKIIKSKNIINYDDVNFLFNYLENNKYQCSNLFNFPDNLE